MEINYIRHNQIDKLRWDECIKVAFNGNLYGYSWYLDVVCPGWDALVSQDYSMIMPLTGNRKFGFSYLFRPMLSQQLGLFSISKPQREDTEAFLGAIPSKYRLIQYCLNKNNHPSEIFESIQHNTFELNLEPEYELIKSNYSDNHRRNIKKAKASGSQIIKDLNKKDFIDLLMRDGSAGSKILSEKKNLSQLRDLLDKMKSNDALQIIGLNNEEGKLIAGVLFGYSHNKWYYLVPVNSDEGKKKRALFIIIDHIIQSRSGREGILDFEGSDIPGLAQFYGGFGAVAEQYTEIRRNTLPWPIKYLK